MSSFWQVFDSHMAIFRRVRYTPTHILPNLGNTLKNNHGDCILQNITKYLTCACINSTIHHPPAGSDQWLQCARTPVLCSGPGPRPPWGHYTSTTQDRGATLQAAPGHRGPTAPRHRAPTVLRVMDFFT